MQRKVNKRIVTVKEVAKPSRFLVNLAVNDDPKVVSQDKKFFAFRKRKEKIKPAKKKEVFYFEKNIDKKDIINEEKFVGYNKADNPPLEIILEKSNHENIQNLNSNYDIFEEFPENDNNIVNRLAFYSIFKTIFSFFKFFYRFCFAIGWLIIYLIRFLYFTIAYIGRTFGRMKLRTIKNAPVHSINFANYNFDEPVIITEEQKRKKIHINLLFFLKKIFNIFIFPFSTLFGLLNKLKTKRKAKKESLKDDDADIAVKMAKENKEQEINEAKIFTWKFFISPSAFRPALYFSIFLLVIILPIKLFTFYFDMNELKGRILGVSEAAALDIKNAADSAANKDFGEASENFNKASKNFLDAKNEISDISGFFSILSALIPNQKIKLAGDAESILEAGKLSAELGSYFSFVLEPLNSNGDEKIKTILDRLHEYGPKMVASSKMLDETIRKIDAKSLPEEYQEKFLIISNNSLLISGSVEEAVDLAEKARIFLGVEKDTRYLLVFQNNTEMRASGGFMGSYALIDFQNGKIKNIEVPGGGTYDTEAGLLKRIKAPEALWIVNPLWHFWDANWWPDWPTTAQKLEWFYEKSAGPSVDGVISFTPTVIERLLEITGPIDMTAEYGVVIDKNNFIDITQSFAEQKPEVTKRPKKIIGDLMKKMIEELPSKLDKKGFIEMVKLTEKSIQEKHILLYFNNNDLEKKIRDYGWDGSMLDTKWDYLMVVNTNIAGGKSDRKVKESIEHEASISDDGSIIDTIKITRTHTGIKGDKLTGVRNVDWVRVYVPKGSELISAQGFIKPDDSYFEKPDPSWEDDLDVLSSEGAARTDEESGTKVYREFNKTVFANWMMIDPGETLTVYMQYKLPFKINKDELEKGLSDKIQNYINPTQKELLGYALFAQKQPGSIGSEFQHNVLMPNSFRFAQSNPKNAETQGDKQIFKNNLIIDKYFVSYFEKK